MSNTQPKVGILGLIKRKILKQTPKYQGFSGVPGPGPGEIAEDNVVVIRYEGPKGGPCIGHVSPKAAE